MDGAAVFQSDRRSTDARESVEKPRQDSSHGSKGTNGNGRAEPTNLSGPTSGARTPPPELVAGGEADLLGQDQIRDLFQNERGIAVRMDTKSR